MKKTLIYIHGKGGTPDEADHYKPLFPDYDVTGFDYRSDNPWDAKKEFPEYFDRVTAGSDEVILAANSIGAYFAMCSLSDKKIDRAFFISPIVDMERLIFRMMLWAGVTEQQLKEQGEIQTSFGETLSWEYLSYVRNHPVKWGIPTDILYGENDELTSFETMSEFAEKTGASLTVMKNGEHWFHTDEQMAFLDSWIAKKKDWRK